MEQFVAWKAMMAANEPTTLWQQFYVLFYQAFIENDRWLQYLNGVVTTLYVTVLALMLGVILGIIVAVIRTAHDQQRKGRRNPLQRFPDAEQDQSVHRELNQVLQNPGPHNRPESFIAR